MHWFLAIVALAGGAAAADPRGSAGCVTLDDRPCYGDVGGERGAELQALEAAALPRRQIEDNVLQQINRGNCAGAREAAQRLGEQALLARVRLACGVAPQAPKARDLRLW